MSTQTAAATQRSLSPLYKRSEDLLSIVLSWPLPHVEKSIAMAFAVYARGPRHDCMTAAPDLAAHTTLCVATIYRHLPELVTLGYLHKQPRFDERGMKIATQYRLILPDVQLRPIPRYNLSLIRRVCSWELQATDQTS